MKCTTENSIKEVQKNNQIAEDKKKENIHASAMLPKGHRGR